MVRGHDPDFPAVAEVSNTVAFVPSYVFVTGGGDRPGTRMRRWRVKRLQVEYLQNASRERGRVCEGKKGEEEVYELEKR